MNVFGLNITLSRKGTLTPDDPAFWDRLDGMIGNTVKSGASVTTTSALEVTAVLGCVRVLAEGIAQLPLKVYRETEAGGKAPAREHPAFKILHRRPNDWMTSFEFREMMMIHTVLTGAGLAFKNMVNGKLYELIPLVPGQVRVTQAADFTLSYEVRDGQGKVVGTYGQDQILHLRGPSWDGWSGLNAVRLAREAIGLSMAGEEASARLHSNGTRPGGLISFEGKLDDEARTRLKESWAEHQQGVKNAFKTVVLDNGAKFTPFAMTAEDAQTIETRRFQIEEICRAFRVFPQMVMQADKASTYASAEQFFLAHVIHSLGPWIERWEQRLDADLLGNEDGLFTRFAVEGLLRGAAKDRSEFYAKGISAGWLTRNEARKLEDLDPIDGLSDPLTPMNMAPGGTTGDENND